MFMDFPYRVGAEGRTAATTGDDYIRDLIEQVLFTAPGERVNRPTFGSGVLELVFAPSGEALAAAMQLSVQGALQQILGELIQVDRVDATSYEGELRITVQYSVRSTQQRLTTEFVRKV